MYYIFKSKTKDDFLRTLSCKEGMTIRKIFKLETSSSTMLFSETRFAAILSDEKGCEDLKEMATITFLHSEERKYDKFYDNTIVRELLIAGRLAFDANNMTLHIIEPKSDLLLYVNNMIDSVRTSFPIYDFIEELPKHVDDYDRADAVAICNALDINKALNNLKTEKVSITSLLPRLTKETAFIIDWLMGEKLIKVNIDGKFILLCDALTFIEKLISLNTDEYKINYPNKISAIEIITRHIIEKTNKEKSELTKIGNIFVQLYLIEENS